MCDYCGATTVKNGAACGCSQKLTAEDACLPFLFPRHRQNNEETELRYQKKIKSIKIIKKKLTCWSSNRLGSGRTDTYHSIYTALVTIAPHHSSAPYNSTSPSQSSPTNSSTLTICGPSNGYPTSPKPSKKLSSVRVNSWSFTNNFVTGAAKARALIFQ